MNKVVNACYFASLKHTFQRRKNTTKDPYINHPIEVMHVLTECGITDVDTLCGAVLHDTIEDTETSNDEILFKFGKDVLLIVEECSDNKALDKVLRKKLQIEHAEHISDKAKLVKLADKYSNVHGLLNDPPAKWSKKEIIGYVRWAFVCCSHMYGVNESLDTMLKRLFELHNVINVTDAELEEYYDLICESE